MTGKNKKFCWTKDCERSFQELKVALTTAPVMSYPNPEGMFILDTDASDIGMGAVLSQQQLQDNGKWIEKPIAYASKKFDPRERRYCARKREMLAIIRMVKHFDVYLRGPTFLIRTDHASLRYIRTLSQPTAQFFRWIMLLEEYSYKLEVRKGILHGNADAMSRGCHGNGCICEELVEYERRNNVRRGLIMDNQTEDIKSLEVNPHVAYETTEFCCMTDCVVQAFKLNPKYSSPELGVMQDQDPDIGPVKRKFEEDSITEPTWNDISEYSATTKAYISEWDRLSLHGGALYGNW